VTDVGRLEGVAVAVDGRYVRRPGMGIHRYLQQVVRLLLEAGAEVTLLTNFPAEAFAHDYPGVAWLVQSTRYNIHWEQVSLPRLLADHDFDIYWAPANMGIPFLSPGRTLSVWTLHDLAPLRLPGMYLWRRPGFAGPYFVWTLAGLLRSDVILTDSHASARDLHALCLRTATVAPPVWYKDDFGPAVVGAELSAPAGEPVPPGSSYFLYNGGNDPRKNVRRLLEAFRLVLDREPKLSLVLMGNGYETLTPLYDELGIRDNVILTGYVSEGAKSEFLRGAVALVYPSLFEGYGLPILEAFAHGTPVIAANCSSLPEIAGNAALYVDPRDPRSIAQAMLSVGDSEVQARLRAAGAARWSAYDAHAVRASVLARLEQALERKTTGRGPPYARS
jgi:glycosyltransferase involved in cell wall biosynthesis